MRRSSRWLAICLGLGLATCSDGTPASIPAGPIDGVRIVVEPGDGGRAFLAALQGARSSVHMTMYLLTDDDVVHALIERRRAGVDVKVVLNQVFPSGGATNARSFAALQAAGVPVVWAPSRFRLTHAKTAVVDGAAAWIMTMNASTSAPASNREYLAVDVEPADVREAEAVFQADFTGSTAAASGPLVVAPTGARAALEALVATAISRLDFEVEEMTDAAAIRWMCEAAARGAIVRGVVPGGAASPAQARASARLLACGVDVRRLAVPYVHAKAIAVDGARAYVGSENFTAASLDDNREIGIVTAASAAVSAVSSRIAADFSAAAEARPEGDE